MGLAFKWVLDPECKELGRCLGSLGVCMPMWAHMLGPHEIAVSYTMPLMSFAFVLGKAPAKCYLHCMHSCWEVHLQKRVHYILQDSSVI